MRELKSKILFVDDEELARRTFKRIADSEFRVLLAESVDEAIQVLEAEHEDIGLLLTDQRMPGKLGVDLLEHCRKEYPKIVRMITTAYSELDDAIAAVNRGEIMRYIEKPWGNIDGLLIDLRVAMSLFEMRIENDLLMAEKLSAGYRVARLDKIRTLITVAACQNYKGNLQAIESLLRQISDVESFGQLPDLQELQNYQIFGQPLTESVFGAEIGRYLYEDTDQHNAVDNWVKLVSSLKANDILLEMAKEPDSPPPAELFAILNSFQKSLGDENALTGNINCNEQGTEITLNLSSKGSTVISDWMMGTGIDQQQSKKIAALMKTYLLSYDIDALVHLEFDKDGLVQGVNFKLYGDSKSGEIGSTYTDYDWIDDLLILFSR